MPEFKLGDTVRIKAGVFKEFTGRVEGITQTKSLLKVVIDIFGRPKTVIVKFTDAENVPPKNFLDLPISNN